MANGTATTANPAPLIKPKVSSEDWIMRAVLMGIALYLLVSIVLPLYAILSKSFKNADGVFVVDAKTIKQSRLLRVEPAFEEVDVLQKKMEHTICMIWKVIR